MIGDKDERDTPVGSRAVTIVTAMYLFAAAMDALFITQGLRDDRIRLKAKFDAINRQVELLRLEKTNRVRLQSADPAQDHIHLMGRDAGVIEEDPGRDKRMGALLELADKFGDDLGFVASAIMRSELSGQSPAFLIGNSGQLPEGFGALFQLTIADTETLGLALASAKRRVDDLIIANASVSKDEQETYIITVRALPPDVVKEVKDELLATFRDILGENGYRALAQLNGERTVLIPPQPGESSSEPRQFTVGGPDEFLNSFGRFSSTIQISHTASGYSYKIIRDKPVGNGQVRPAIGRSQGTAPTLEQLALPIGPAIRLLPAGI